MIKTYVSEQLVKELEEVYSFAKLPDGQAIINGITIQEVAYRSGVRDVIKALRHASDQGTNETPLL